MRIVYLLILLTFSSASYAIEHITISRGHFDPIPIAINRFSSDNPAESVTAEQIINVITNDLKRSGLFRPISSGSFIDRQMGITHKPLFVAWRQINANLLVNGSIRQIQGNKLKVSFILWDTVLEKDMLAEEFELPIKLWRRVAHKIADKIYEKATGDKGYFDSKIAYISETGPAIKKIKRIAIMDQDGANHQFLTDGRYLVLTPRFSPQADKILYLSYAKRNPRLHMLNLKTGRESVVGNFPGMSFAPRFSPNGTKALMSIAKHGATHIYEIDLKTLRLSKLTSGNGIINTSPGYSPDGKKIVFNSDRSGSRQLYTMNVDGSEVQRISFGGGAYSAPAWSPRGDYIAFTKLTRSEGFTIGVMRANTISEDNGERIIASGYLVEGPTWAENGRVIMYTKESRSTSKSGSKSRIYSIDLTGYNEQIISTPKDASDPEWSRLLD